MIRGVNLLALVVVVTAGVLTGLGKLEPESFLLLVTGLAIPARADGYQSVGTGAQRVEVINGPGNPAAVEDVGDVGSITVVEACLILLFLLVVLLVLGVIPR